MKDAIPIAAQKGDHRPARELLQHVGIVEDNKNAGIGLLVLTRTVVNGVPAVRGSDGNIYDINPETGEVENLPQAETIVQVGLDASVVKFTDAAAAAANVIEINGIDLHGVSHSADSTTETTPSNVQQMAHRNDPLSPELSLPRDKTS